MKTPILTGRKARMCRFLRSLVAWLGSVSCGVIVTGVEPDHGRLPNLDRPAIERMLRGFDPQGADRRTLETWLEELDSPQFLIRDRAMRDLLALPAISPGLLADVGKRGSTEVRLAVRRLQAAHSGQRIDRVLHVAYSSIQRRCFHGLCSEVLGSLPYAERVSTLRLGQEALIATVEKGDESTLRSSLAAKSPVVRRTAATALAQLLGTDSLEDLLPLIQDPDAKVRLDVAVALANLGRRESFSPMIGLLQHNAFVIRWRASEALMALTGESLGYRPEDTPSLRAASLVRWQQWLAVESRACALKTPIEVPTRLSMFNGRDLTGWVSHAAKPTEPNRLWEIRDGVLSSIAKQKGDLRTRAAFGDYRLTFQWQMPAASGNSGIGVALADASSTQPVYLEIQLHPNNSGDLHVVGGMKATSGGEPIGSRAVKWRQSNERYRQWNEMEIVVRRGYVTVLVNGRIQNEASDCPRGPSHILIRNEGSLVQFRDIVLEPLE